MRLPVIKDAGFRCVGFVSDPPGDFKAKQMLLSLFICQPSGTVSPVPDQGIWSAYTSPVERAKAVIGRKLPFLASFPQITLSRHTVLFGRHKIPVGISFKGQHSRNVFQSRRDYY